MDGAGWALVGALAGWLDAVVGGGGLVQLPALMLGLPGATPAAWLATNKVGSLSGTAMSALTYARSFRPQWRTALPLALTAGTGSMMGAFIGLRISKEAFSPIVLVLLVAMGTYVVAKPQLGRAEKPVDPTRAGVLAALIGLVAGVYDGALGPGTGSILVFGLVSVLGMQFLEASALAKIANVATNVGALIVFAPGGHIIWAVAGCLVLGQLVGGVVGARTAVRLGSTFVRTVFIVVVGSLATRIAGQLLGWWS